MAIIHGRVPETKPAAARTRVIVKLAASAPATRPPAVAQSPERASILTELRRVAPQMDFRPYFDEDAVRATRLPPFDRYVVADVADRGTAVALVGKLQELKGVEEAYIEGAPTPPPVNPLDDPRSGSQGYLDAAPGGIDARWVWSLTDGFNIRFVDLERGWTLNPEDLNAAGISLISGLNQDFHGHGTSVLGQVVASDNTRGGVGIAPRATARVVSQWRTATTYNTAAAILSAGQAMSAGDVLLLEAQTDFGGLTDMPVEVETAVFDAIRHVVDNGIVVIEAAGNGGHDLDTFQDAANRRRLDRTSADFRDSGAIMVGAGGSAAPHARLGFSNHGSRIDCYGWGENIDTTGDGWQGTSTTAYTSGFGGTSGASPMIAGAAVLLQSWRKARLKRVFSPEHLRDMLSSTDLNTPSANPSADRIGVMPDLRAILEAEIEKDRYRVPTEKYLSLVYILIGLVDDAPGVIWVPGKGPVPVDPGWGKVVKGIEAPKRDLLAALAANEIASLIDDAATRARLSDATVGAMHAAVERIGRLG